MSAHLMIGFALLLLAIGCGVFVVSGRKRDSLWRVWAACQCYSASLGAIYFFARATS